MTTFIVKTRRIAPSNRQKEAFKIYLGLGKERSYNKVAKMGFGSASGVALWAKKFQWQEQIIKFEGEKYFEGLNEGEQIKTVSELHSLCVTIGFLGDYPKGMPKAERLEHDKLKFIESLWKCGGTIGAALKDSRIPRTQYIKWKEEDEEFRAIVEDLNLTLTDAVENKLLQKALDGDIKAIEIYLKGNRPEIYNRGMKITLPPGTRLDAALKLQTGEGGDLSDDALAEAKEIIQIMLDAKGIETDKRGTNERIATSDIPEVEQIYPTSTDGETGSVPPDSE